MKKVLITGGYGNLGSWIVAHLSKNKKFDIYVLARKKKELLFEHSFIKCDVTSLKNCKKALRNHNFNFVIHLASSNDFFKDNYSEKSILTNILGTRNLLETLNLKPIKNFIYFSTFHVYGKNTGIISETTKTNPKNDYAISHLVAEEYVNFFNLTQNLPFTILRLTNGYGCPKDIDSSKWYLLLNDICKSAYENKVIKLNSNGKSQRDFIWMQDVCTMVENIVSSPNITFNDTFNLSAEKTFSVLEIANKVKEAFLITFNNNIDIEINHSDKNNYVSNLEVSSQKLQKLIPFTTKEHFIKEAINIFKFLKSNSV